MEHRILNPEVGWFESPGAHQVRGTFCQRHRQPGQRLGNIWAISRLVPSERSSQRVEQGTGPFLALGRSVVAIEEHPLFREDKLR